MHSKTRDDIGVVWAAHKSIRGSIQARFLDIDGDTKDLPWIMHWWYVVVGSRDWLISHHTAMNHNNGPNQ